ncbi:MAG: DUF421 domain-containing protein [Chloroflexota bacterium]|jgi:uncharacterized membrane protein YcaP (DUF421 family)
MFIDWFFISWAGVLRVVVVSVLAYLGMVFLLRISGKRTLTKLNAFDLVITVALGSTLASIILSKEVPLVEGITAFFMLIALQFVITWLSVRSATVRRLVKAEPTLLLYKGEMLLDTMKRERVTEEEVLAAVRGGGVADVEDVEAVILETDGSFSILEKGDGPATVAKRGVGNYPPESS